jgi:hypothetical protein
MNVYLLPPTVRSFLSSFGDKKKRGHLARQRTDVIGGSLMDVCTDRRMVHKNYEVAYI